MSKHMSILHMSQHRNNVDVRAEDLELKAMIRIFSEPHTAPAIAAECVSIHLFLIHHHNSSYLNISRCYCATTIKNLLNDNQDFLPKSRGASPPPHTHTW